MGWNKQETLEFIQNLITLYFQKREVKNLPDYMEDYTSWIGTGEGELCRNLFEAKKILEKDVKEYSGSFIVEHSQFEILPLSDVSCIAYGQLFAEPKNPNIASEHLRLTCVIHKKKDQLKLVHMHFSHPDMDQRKGRFFVKKADKADKLTLRQTIHERDIELTKLIDNIPGGIHQCKNDADLTLLSMSNGFLSMFGYTKIEIETLFDGKFMNMVYPLDRAKMLNTLQEQAKKGDKIELEYRVLCKNGSPIWVLDKGKLTQQKNGSSYYCQLIEIGKRKKQEEDLRLSLERHQVIMDQTTDIIFEWDILSDTLSFSSNWKKKFGYRAIENQISKSIPISHNMHPDDIVAFSKIMNDVATGVPYCETEFRIKNSEGCYYWCRIRATTQYDPDHRPIKAVGVIIDIDAEKKQKEALLEQAQRDALTGLFNKTAVKLLVERSMKTQDNENIYHAFLIIDVDEFKTVNDTFGHLAGDSVLSDVATILKNTTRSSDVVGRIGGDEFIVYLANIKNSSAVHKKVKQILDSLRKITPDTNVSPITCSIGVVVCPQQNTDYYSLYKHADLALYHQKHNGRNGASYYDDNINYTERKFSKTSINSMIVSDENTVDESLAQYAFRALYGAKDIQSSIKRLLEILGRSFDVSRVYIFESTADRERCCNTFEWCNENVTAQIDELQELSYLDDLDNYLDNFNEHGMFYCHNIKKLPPNLYAVLKPQGICSMLQCAMLDQDEFVGYVGFDECRSNRKWSNRQITSFKLTADVISSFLIKMRQKEELERLRK